MKCSKCSVEVEMGEDGSLYWARCPKCSFYCEAGSMGAVLERLKPSEKQEITSNDIGKLEDVLG